MISIINTANLRSSFHAPNLTSIVESPGETVQPTSGALNNSRHIINLKELNSSNMFRQRKITTPNAHAVQLRVLNNIRTQRACRFSIKKTAISNIVKNYNSQRLTNEECAQMTVADNPLTRNRVSRERRDKKCGKF